MARYHINHRGDVGKCNAKKSCPFGDVVRDHFDSASEARDAYELRRSGETFKKLSRERSDYRSSLYSLGDRYLKRLLRVWLIFWTLVPPSR